MNPVVTDLAMASVELIVTVRFATGCGCTGSRLAQVLELLYRLSLLPLRVSAVRVHDVFAQLQLFLR